MGWIIVCVCVYLKEKVAGFQKDGGQLRTGEGRKYRCINLHLYKLFWQRSQNMIVFMWASIWVRQVSLLREVIQEPSPLHSHCYTVSCDAIFIWRVETGSPPWAWSSPRETGRRGSKWASDFLFTGGDTQVAPSLSIGENLVIWPHKTAGRTGI